MWCVHWKESVFLVLKDFTDQKRDEKMYKKVPIFRCTTPSTGKRLREVVVGTLYIYSSRFWSVKSFKTLSECESRIVGRSPNFWFSWCAGVAS